MHLQESGVFAGALGDWKAGAGSAYRRLASAIRARAEAGALAVGARLPAERSLASALGVSRTTVVAAYELLRQEGWLESRRGSGSRVARSGARGAPGRAEHGVFERSAILRSLVEASGSWIEFMGLHLPAAAPYVTEALAQGTKDNEALRVFAAGGYNDLVTSYYALQYMLQHSGIDSARVTIRDYPGGHMMYLHQPSAEQLSNDIVAFIQK